MPSSTRRRRDERAHRRGRWHALALFLFLVLSTLSCAEQQQSDVPLTVHLPPAMLGTYRALVIGNAEYIDPQIPPLKTALADAMAIAQLLEQTYGYRVKLLLNATRVQIKDELDQLRSVGQDENVLIYYAGHGHLDEPTRSGYWLPVDADAKHTANWISTADVTTTLRAVNAKHIIVIADSCYAGTLLRSGPSGPRDSAYLLRLASKKARVVLTSGGDEPVADDGHDGHSIFAYYLLKLLSQNMGTLDGTRLFADLRPLVGDNADQTPQYGVIRETGHEGGDFLFRKREPIMMSPESSLKVARNASAASRSEGGQLAKPGTPASPAVHAVVKSPSDKDHDGIPDAYDKCPNEPEDMDGFQDQDGCPDPDNDGDGIRDDDDECVDEPETKNGFQDEDGCPDAPGPVGHRDQSTGACREQITDMVYFPFEVALPPIQSRDVLDEVIKKLKARSEIKWIAVVGFTDNKESDGEKLGMRRADAVVRYLTDHGISGSRVISQYGKRKPMTSDASERDRARNRRVEFKLGCL